MKTKLTSLVVATMVLTGSANAADTFIAGGYGMVNVDGTSSNAPVVEFGVKAGKDFKHTIATKFIFTGENETLSDGQGNIGEIYYSLGYEVLPSTVLGAKVGLGFQQLGSYRTSKGTEAIYSIGLSYGAVATYEVASFLDISASYTTMGLSYMDLNYNVDSIEASLVFKF